MPDRLRILHLTAPAPFGGLERVVTDLARGHQQRGHEVHVAAILSPEEQDHPFLRAFAGSGIQIHPLRFPERAYWNDWLRVSRLCRELSPHVVHSHSVRTDVIAARAALRHGCATLTTVHGVSFQSPLGEWLQRRSYRRFDAVVAVSSAQRELLLQHQLAPRERIRLIPNACSCWGEALPREEARRILGLPADAFIVGWAARMVPVKGGDVFLDALGRLGALEGHVALIGDGPNRAALEQRARSLSWRERVHFLGAREQAGRLFSAFDLFVSSSRSEGMPIAIFEAVAAGVPIVATRVGGIPEMLGEDDALLVPSEDPGALAAAIERARRMQPCFRARAERAIRSVQERYGVEPWLASYEQVYRDVAGRE